MSDFAQRLLLEKQQLDERLGKLRSFLQSEAFSSVAPLQQTLLQDQSLAMSQYAAILHERIKALGELPKPQLSFGEMAVGITFNPGGKPEVEAIKRLCAAAIDEIKAQEETGTHVGEALAMFTLARRRIQEGQMWGVKAATWQY